MEKYYCERKINNFKKWSDLIIENVDDLAKIMTIEQGKPLAEAKGRNINGCLIH